MGNWQGKPSPVSQETLSQGNKRRPVASTLPSCPPVAAQALYSVLRNSVMESVFFFPQCGHVRLGGGICSYCEARP